MQTISQEQLREMENPRGLDIIHPAKSPTLSKIIDANGKQMHPELFASRNKAEYQLYLMLVKDGKELAKSKKKKLKEDKKQAFDDQEISNYSHVKESK